MLANEQYATIVTYEIKVKGAFLPTRINLHGAKYAAFVAAHGNLAMWYTAPVAPTPHHSRGVICLPP